MDREYEEELLVREESHRQRRARLWASPDPADWPAYYPEEEDQDSDSEDAEEC